MGGIGGDAFRSVRPHERKGRKEVQKALDLVSPELRAYQGKVAGLQPYFDEQMGGAIGRLRESDQALKTAFDFYQGALGQAPGGLAASLLARQREQIGSGVREANQQAANTVGSFGGRPGLLAYLQGKNQIMGRNAVAQGETGFRANAVNQLAQLGLQSTPQQLQRFEMGSNLPFKEATGTLPFLQLLAQLRQTKAGLNSEEAQRRYAEHELSRQNTLKIVNMIAGGFGSRNLG